MSRIFNLFIVLLLALTGVPLVPAVVRAEEPAEAAWKAAPSADAAEKAARAALDKGQLARGINWIERMVRSPGLKPAQTAWAAKMRADLKWKLVDAGFGQLQVSVIPSNAHVTVDGKQLLPVGGNHLVWLAEGGHQVAATAPEHATYDQFVNVVRGEKRDADIRLALTRAPVLVLEVRPVCDVYIDQVRLGASSKGRFTVTPGSHLVELRLDGFVNYIATLNFVVGEEKRMGVQLVKKGDNEPPRPKVSDVDRPILDTERQDHGEVGPDLTAGPQVESPISGRKTQRVTVDRQPKGSSSGPDHPVVGGPSERVASGGDTPPESSGGAAEYSGSVTDSAPSQPWSASTKGWLLAGPGLAALAGGAYFALSSAREAENVNETLTYGDPGYDAAYAKQEQNTYIGYAAMGAGAVLTGWGSYYLLAKGGLSRTGRGALATGVGAAALGAAAYVFLGAQTTLSSTQDLPANHPEIDRRIAVAQSNANVAYGLGGAGALVAGLGVYWLLTGGSSSSTQADLPHQTASSTSHFTLIPQVNAGYSGASLHLAW